MRIRGAALLVLIVAVALAMALGTWAYRGLIERGCRPVGYPPKAGYWECPAPAATPGSSP